MKFLTVCVRGEGLPIALRLQEEGHQSKLCCTDSSLVGDGLVETVKLRREGGPVSFARTIRQEATKDTMIIFTRSSFGYMAEALQKEGYLTFGASPFHQAMQDNFTYANSFSEVYDLPTTPDTLGGAYAIEAWFNGEDFIFPIFGLFPEYGFMAGDIGPATECAGVTGFPFKSFRSPRFASTLEKLRPALKKMDYKGPISIDVMSGAVMRYVCGFRFDFIYLMMQMIEQPFGRLLMDVARGMAKAMRVRFDYGMCVRATFPPYPNRNDNPPTNLAIGLAQDLKDGLIPTGVRQQEKSLIMASFTGDAFCVSGFGATIKEAQSSVYRKIPAFMSPNIQFRIDIGAVALNQIGALLSDGRE